MLLGSLITGKTRHPKLPEDRDEQGTHVGGSEWGGALLLVDKNKTFFRRCGAFHMNPYNTDYIKIICILLIHIGNDKNILYNTSASIYVKRTRLSMSYCCFFAFNCMFRLEASSGKDVVSQLLNNECEKSKEKSREKKTIIQWNITCTFIPREQTFVMF